MDLAEIKTTDRTVEIVHPKTGENIGFRVTLVSIDDERLTKIKRQITDKRLALEARNKSFKAEEIEDNTNALLFAAIIGWEWYNPTGNAGDDGYDATKMPDFRGEQPDFNRKNFNELIEAVRWIRDQINEAVSETKAFFET